jgi:hypothetical protein
MAFAFSVMDWLFLQQQKNDEPALLFLHFFLFPLHWWDN